MDVKVNRGFELSTEMDSNTYHFLGIGIDSYRFLPSLQNAILDINRIQELLVDKFGFHIENTKTILDQKATRRNILDQFDYHSKILSSDDNLIIYFAGHGKIDDHKKGYWAPYNATKDNLNEWVNVATIKDKLDNFSCRHLLLIVDACFPDALFMDNYRNIGTVEGKPSRWGFTSGRDELVKDGEPQQGSPFANSIIKHLEKTEEPLRFTTLVEKVKKDLEVQEEVFQTPRAEPLKIKGHKGGELVFSKRTVHVRKQNAYMPPSANVHDSSLENENRPDSQKENRMIKWLRENNWVTFLLVLILPIIGGLASFTQISDWVNNFYPTFPLIIEGRVFNAQTENPISHVRVSLQGEKGIGDHTDESGDFRIELVSRKKRELSLTFFHSQYESLILDTNIKVSDYQKIFNLSTISLIPCKIDTITELEDQIKPVFPQDSYPGIRKSEKEEKIKPFGDEKTTVKKEETALENTFLVQELSSVVRDQYGSPVPKAKVWCSYCADLDPVYTNSEGEFTILISEKYTQFGTEQIEICVSNKDTIICEQDNFYNLKNIKLPILPK